MGIPETWYQYSDAYSATLELKPALATLDRWATNFSTPQRSVLGELIT